MVNHTEANHGYPGMEKGCLADDTLLCLTNEEICDWPTAFFRQIENAKALGLMPDKAGVTKETLHSFGFYPQDLNPGNPMTKIGIEEGLRRISDNLLDPCTVLFQVSKCEKNNHTLRSVFCLRFDGLIFSEQLSPSLIQSFIDHVWIRFDDGSDHSPFPRPIPIIYYSRDRKPDGIHTLPFHPNPKGLDGTSDDIVRAYSAIAHINWEEALSFLAKYGNTTDLRRNFETVLMDDGMQHHPPIRENGKLLDIKNFCRRMDTAFDNGERIIAKLGKDYYCAVHPSQSGYMFLDCADRSDWKVRDFWIRRPIHYK